MKFLKVNPLILAGLLIVIAAVIMSFLLVERRVKGNAVSTRDSQSVLRHEPQRRVSPAALQPADVAKMTVQDWADRFQKSPSEVSAEYEQEILLLANELAELLKKDPNPNGIEAMVFCDAILTLLSEGRHSE